MRSQLELEYICCEQEQCVCCRRDVNYTGTSLVNVKYARDVADCYGQNVIMKWFDLISNIGSTCGFITGFSFVSVLEFIYFFTIKLIREIRLRRQRVQNSTKVILESQGSGRTEPIKRYRPIYWNEITPSLGPKTT
ncbi:hypothetical protein HF086_007921 [Spodoptera exigua]|uniref:Uncharacterized protein n=1 Tax=Spodoptera exigua TaxID=7107 RepID=A0A922MXM9_SPOEX|nr:hypothetical protein HF086_007921 [Spodoptera exigua]